MPAAAGAERRRFPAQAERDGPVRLDTKDLTPAQGSDPVLRERGLWSDGAIKERFLAIPGDGKIEFETVTYPQPAPGLGPAGASRTAPCW